MEKVANELRSSKSLPGKVCRKLMRSKTRKKKSFRISALWMRALEGFSGLCLFFFFFKPAKRIRDVGSKRGEKTGACASGRGLMEKPFSSRLMPTGEILFKEMC